MPVNFASIDQLLRARRAPRTEEDGQIDQSLPRAIMQISDVEVGDSRETSLLKLKATLVTLSAISKGNPEAAIKALAAGHSDRVEAAQDILGKLPLVIRTLRVVAGALASAAPTTVTDEKSGEGEKPAGNPLSGDACIQRVTGTPSSRMSMVINVNPTHSTPPTLGIYAAQEILDSLRHPEAHGTGGVYKIIEQYTPLTDTSTRHGINLALKDLSAVFAMDPDPSRKLLVSHAASALESLRVQFAAKSLPEQTSAELKRMTHNDTVRQAMIQAIDAPSRTALHTPTVSRKPTPKAGDPAAPRRESATSSLTSAPTGTSSPPPPPSSSRARRGG